MRKNLKRAVSAILVVVMILAMLPVIATAATERFTATPIAGVPQPGAAFIIFAPSASVAMGSEATGGKTTGFDTLANEENSNLEISSGTGLYKLKAAPTAGTYYLTCGGKYYTATATSKAAFYDAPQSKGSVWKIEALEGGYRIANTDWFYNSNPACIEVYGSAFSPYGFDATNLGYYTMAFYSVDESKADPDGDGYIGTKPVAQPLPVNGDKVVIYNAYAESVFGPQTADLTAPSVEPIVSAINDDGTINVGNGGYIFNVSVSGGYYTFEHKGKYLAVSDAKDDSGNSTECICYSDKNDDYSKWTLEAVTGGYVMYNKTAAYKGSKVAIEFFSSTFSGWTYNGSTHLFAMNFYKVEDKYNLGYVLNPKVNIKANDAFVGMDYNFSFVLDDLTKITSLKVEYDVGSGFQEISPKEVKAYNYEGTVSKDALAGKSEMRIRVTAKNEYNMEYTDTVTVTINDEPLIISVSPMPNAATGSEKRPEISAVIANCDTNPKVVMTIDGTEVKATVTATKVSYKPTAAMTDDRHVVELTIYRGDGKQTTMTWSFFVGEAGMSLYFGQIHSHTAEYSDGAGQLEDAYEHAMAANDVDYLIVTDHSNYFDTTSTAKTTSYYDLSSLTKNGSTTKWEQARATAAEYNEKTDSFVAAYGYEMTWSGGPGHTNSFNTYGTVSRNNSSLNEKTNSYAGMHLYNDLMVNANNGLDVDGNAVAEGVKTKYIEEAPVVSQFNHPGTTFGTFDDFAGYTPLRDSVLCLVEVGNGEGKVGGSSYWPSYSEYDKALAKGWHVAPTNNQDNHKGKWGDSNTCRDVILTENFSEAGLYEAMSQRRVYSTEDQNLRIYYYMNNEIMGSVIDTGDETLKTLNVTASISDPDGEKIGKIEIIGENGVTLKTYTAAGSTYELKDTINNTDAYYYIKVTEADGDIAVTAPIWIGEATPITCDLKTNAALCVVGQKETITSTLTNAAEKDYTISRVRFTLVDAKGEETTIKEFKETATVAAGESKTYSFDYARAISGDQKIVVTYTGKYNGKSFTCQANISNKVYNQNELINVAIDRGHDNYYVSGDYAGSVGSFIEYAAQNGVQVKYLEEGEFTFKNLKKYSMVILTVNYLRTTRKAKDYTDDEIAALKQYAEIGGRIIICSKSDRDNPFDNCAANSNKLLEAIGAHSRIVNGIIVDNDLAASEKYRVYFSSVENFNVDHRFTKGVYTASNAFGTRPATDNQTGFQMYNGAPIEVLDDSKVEVLVKGYDTTWGSHYDGYFTSASFVPEYDPNNTETTTVKMGDVNIMTYEDLPAGGWVVTSGVTFLSNYDIKNDADYANKFIAQNILLDLTRADDGLVITPISKVKKVAASDPPKQHTIEGYVTSNASAYDQDTAFFDCIYVQDKQGNGINAFPVAGNFAIGMNVRAHGAVTYYCGEVELNLSSDYNGYCRVISDDVYVVPPKDVDCKTAMSDAEIGNLLQVKGVVTNIHKTEGVIDKIYVRDAAGEACLFINGYIMKDYKGLDDLKVGMIVSGIGIGSRDVDEQSATSAIFSRLRVRNRSEIVILDKQIHSDVLFTDVKETDWFYDSVLAVVERGLMNGTSTSTFAPNATLTRGMVATILYRMAGEKKASSKASFKDVADGAWYADAVSWAQSTGVVNGYEDNTFRPNNNVTRQEMAVMLARYAQLIEGKNISVDGGSLNAFPDGNTVPAWAREAVIWAVANGIINGMNGKIAPNENATRAQFAAIIIRYINLETVKTEPQ